MSDDAVPQVAPLGGGRFELVDASRRRIAYAVRSGSEAWVFLDGRVHVVTAPGSAARRSAARADDEASLAAPMPATVVSVQVEPGQQVAKGDVLVTLEAMKMEIAIRAPRGAVVRSVSCRPGELVQPGVPLLELA